MLTRAALGGGFTDSSEDLVKRHVGRLLAPRYPQPIPASPARTGLVYVAVYLTVT